MAEPGPHRPFALMSSLAFSSALVVLCIKDSPLSNGNVLHDLSKSVSDLVESHVCTHPLHSGEHVIA